MHDLHWRPPCLSRDLPIQLSKQDRFCDSFRQYAYKKIIICQLFMQKSRLSDPSALLRRLSKIHVLPRPFCRTHRRRSGIRIAF
ncbi:hypothetical protein MPLA_1830041 [Mesorhizobium sp. ORS 3359]|nr:hypothetical protein MPLA_1830041 [Mesorhizobium sp. ORS 3359]